jgi:hypothetical protein
MLSVKSGSDMREAHLMLFNDLSFEDRRSVIVSPDNTGEAGSAFFSPSSFGSFLERLLERHGTGDWLALLSVRPKWIGPLLPGVLPDRIRWWIGKLHVLGNTRDRKCGG